MWLQGLYELVTVSSISIVGFPSTPITVVNVICDSVHSILDTSERPICTWLMPLIECSQDRTRTCM